MSCHHCQFPSGSGENIWEKFYALEFTAKLLGGPPCYPIGSLVELLIPFVQPSNMFCLFTEIHWSLDEVILAFLNNIGECYAVVLKGQ
jgi:hypothetical protein